jgi:hypothetical protein
MNQPHRDMDDTADFAMSRFHPAEACSELGAEPEPKKTGVGTRGTGPTPDFLLVMAVVGFCVVLAMLLAHWWPK